LNRFILMLQFFTRIPINKTVSVEADDFKYGSIFLPVVGLVIGLISVCAYIIASYTRNNLFSAVITVMALACVTGALHLDGLSDSFDGLFSSRSRERILEIMKDSRIGTMGALALIFSVLLKVSLIYGMSYKGALYSIIIAPVISRTSLLFGVAISKYARESGLGKTFIGNVTCKEFVKGFIICIIIILPLLKLYSLVFVPLIFIGPWLINRYIKSKIGGMTGDTVGALCELQEIMSFIVLAVLSNYIWK
jgi:adenosylcobinamide-GDP ribazoletransferase